MVGSTTETRKQGDGTEGRRHPGALRRWPQNEQDLQRGGKERVEAGGWSPGCGGAGAPGSRPEADRRTRLRRSTRDASVTKGEGSSLQTLLPRDVPPSRTRGQTGVPGLGQSPRAGGHQRQDSCRDEQVPGGQWSLLPLGRVTELCTVPCSGPGGVGPASTRENVRLARELQGQCPGGTDPPCSVATGPLTLRVAP